MRQGIQRDQLNTIGCQKIQAVRLDWCFFKSERLEENRIERFEVTYMVGLQRLVEVVG